MKLRLFLLSFFILFLELTLIRYIPANIRLVGYFTNLILLASFLGMGIGILLSSRKINLINFFPITLLILVALPVLFKADTVIISPQELFFQKLEVPNEGVKMEFVLPIVFIIVSSIFAFISREFGKIFSKFPPLIAYILDIGGALTGTIVFSVLSFLSSPAYLWFVVISFLFLILLVYKNLASQF